MIGQRAGPGGGFARRLIMCSPVQIIPALPEAAACGFTMPVRYDGEICR
jgi:hypothetical protein